MVPADQLEGAGQVQGHDHGDNLPLSLSVAVLLKELAVQQANLVLPTRAFETSLARSRLGTIFCRLVLTSRRCSKSCLRISPRG